MPNPEIKSSPASKPKSLRATAHQGIDTLIENAFAPRETPISTPRTRHEELNRMSGATYEPLSGSACAPAPPQEDSADPLWDKVRQSTRKEEQIAQLPSKIKSLDIDAALQEGPVGDRKLVRRASMVNFRESVDGRTMTASIDISGVKKQDMHVSFRSHRLIVTWRRIKITERKEAGVVIRDRLEKQYNQIIPMPEGAKFEEIRASRDGRRLMLTYPNVRCIRVQPDTSSTAHSGGTTTEFHTCKPLE